MFGQKKVLLCPEIGQVKKCLSPIRPHKSNMYENIYFLFQKNTQTKKFPQANLFVQIYVFSLQKVKDRPLCFSAKKSAVRVVFKCKRYLKNSMKLIKKFFFLRPPGWKFFSSPAFPETRVLLLFFFLALSSHVLLFCLQVGKCSRRASKKTEKCTHLLTNMEYFEFSVPNFNKDISYSYNK